MKLEQEGQENKKPTMTVVESLAVDKKVKTVNNLIVRVEDSKRIFSETTEKVDSYEV